MLQNIEQLCMECICLKHDLSTPCDKAIKLHNEHQLSRVSVSQTSLAQHANAIKFHIFIVTKFMIIT